MRASWFIQAGRRLGLCATRPVAWPWRACSSLSSLAGADLVDAREPRFRTVYRWPHMGLLLALTRFKIWQTGLAVGVVLPSYAHLIASGSVHPEYGPQVFGATALSVSVLLALGERTRRLIGAVYFDPETAQVKISHLSFFGARVDRVFDLDEIVLMSETQEESHFWLWAVHFRDESHRHLLMCTKWGHIVDPERFDEIFGTDLARS